MNKKLIGIAVALAIALAGCVQLDVFRGRGGFVSLAEAVPDAILEIRYYSTYNFTGERIDGYERPCAPRRSRLRATRASSAGIA